MDRLQTLISMFKIKLSRLKKNPETIISENIKNTEIKTTYVLDNNSNKIDT